MMNRILSICSVGLALAVLAGSAPAQRADRPERGERLRERAASRPAVERFRKLEELIKDLQLTDDQKQQVQQIVDTHRQDVNNWRKENSQNLQDLSKQLKQAKEAKDQDKDKIQSLHSQIDKLVQSRKALFDNLLKQLKDVLKPEQFEKVEEFVKGDRDRDVVNASLAATQPSHPGLAVLEKLLGDLKLTDQQKQQVQAIQDEAKKQADETKDPEQKQKIRLAAIERIKKDVFTPEQRSVAQRLEVAHRLLMAFGRLNLTDDQKTQIREILEQAKGQIQKAATEQDKRNINEQAFKKIFDTVLTQAQRDKLNEIKNGRDKPGRDWRRLRSASRSSGDAS